MTGRNFLLPRAASPDSLRHLLFLLLVVLCCCAPAVPASSVGRQGPGGEAGQSGGRGVLSNVWRHGASPHPLRTDDLNIPEGGGEVVGVRTWTDSGLNGDYSDTRTVELQKKRHLYKGEYPVSRKTGHRSRGSLDADERASKTSKRSSSSFFVSPDWSRATSSSGRKGPRDIRPGNWPQEAGEFERVSSGDEGKRKASQSQHKSSIMRQRGEGRRPARGDEIPSRRGREVLEDNILASSQNNLQQDGNIARFTFDSSDNSGHSGVPLEEPLAAMGEEGDPDIGDSFGVPAESPGNLEQIHPSINPARYPLQEHQWHPPRGTMPLEPLETGFSDSWGTNAYGGILEPEQDDKRTYEWKEVLAREKAALEAHTLMVQQPALENPGCGCWETDTPKSYWECSCWNCDLTQVPANFSDLVSIITLTNVGLKTIRNDSFIRYRTTLSDLVLEKMEELSTIEAGAFKGLNHLRSIYIHSAPKLRSMPNLTINADNTKLMIFRITNSGLEEIPFIENAASGNIIHMIEMDTNRIRKVGSRSLHVMVDLLSLNYNLIEEVEKEAFAGSQIAKLSLKGNTRLRSLHPEAFKGIGSLQTLDLSETSITSLPTMGLTDLEVLILERTPTLKVFPSVYSFKSIEKAQLTYPYHCCAFQFPQQHDPRRHMESMKKMEQFCSDVTTPNPGHSAPTTRPRRRRFKFSTVPSPVEALPSGAVYGQAPADYNPEQGNPGERWGGPSHGEGWGTVSLSSPSNGDEFGGNAKRHERSRQFERPQASPESSSDKLLHSTSPLRRRELPETTTDAATSSLPHAHARHSGHHTRLLKPQSEPDTQSAEGSGHPSVKPKGRSRRGSHTQAGSRMARAPRSQDGAKVALRLESHFGQQAAALIRESEQMTIPRPEKRDPYNEHLDFQSNSPRKEFVGGGVENTYPFPLGFGSFNNTYGKVPPSIIPKPNTSTQGWESHGWSEEAPPLDSGDEATYLLNSPGHPRDSHPGQVDGTFHSGSGNFNSAPVVDVWHKGHKDGGSKPSSTWLPKQVNISSKNNNMYFKCGNLSKDYHDVQCEPGPDAFNPCEDIMGNIALRVAVWVVVVTAVVGNLAVMIVLISSKFKMTVSKFLMVNLALADLCMGLYLLIIAAMDLHTIGDYFNYAIDWQNGPGCKVAGFLTVFASELSIFTLTVITSERWYAITYAIHLNKRLKLSMAMKIMVGGWTYSIAMATLPLVGVSSYSKTSICLPMETGDGLSLAYLVSLLLVNGLAFFVITACYISMYFSISRHDATTEHSDLTVAKRMALLVFTDFACWAPIAFFGLTAVAGLPLINVTRAKILLVFFYPLNSCANPYLYAILTKQYRRDLFILLARYGFCTKRAMKYKGAYSSVNNTFPHNTVVNAANHRSSTLTQITLCDLTRTRTSQQSNNGSLLGGTIVGGSQDSLQRNVSPLRTPTKPETACGCSGAENERLSTVQEMSHSNPSDEEPSDDHIPSGDDDSHSGVMKQAGSPHPIKNCYTRLSFTPEQEEILKHALNVSKAKKKRGRSETENVDQAAQELLGDQRKPSIENGSSLCQGEAIVICEMDLCRENCETDSRNKRRISRVNEEEEEEEAGKLANEELVGKTEATSSV